MLTDVKQTLGHHFAIFPLIESNEVRLHVPPSVHPPNKENSISVLPPRGLPSVLPTPPLVGGSGGRSLDLRASGESPGEHG